MPEPRSGDSAPTSSHEAVNVGVDNHVVTDPWAPLAEQRWTTWSDLVRIAHAREENR